jgi:hypothetical protein
MCSVEAALARLVWPPMDWMKVSEGAPYDSVTSMDQLPPVTGPVPMEAPPNSTVTCAPLMPEPDSVKVPPVVLLPMLREPSAGVISCGAAGTMTIEIGEVSGEMKPFALCSNQSVCAPYGRLTKSPTQPAAVPTRVPTSVPAAEPSAPSEYT